MYKYNLKKFIRFIVVLLFLLFLNNDFVLAAEDYHYQIENGFYIEGITLYDANDNPFIMKGINYPHTWFKTQYHTAIPAIANTGANTVRVVLSDGNRWPRDNVRSIQEVLDLIEEYNMISVLEVHDATGRDDYAALQSAVDYWISLKEFLIGKEDSVIINIANEWYGSWSGREWAEGYQKAIPQLREAGLNHTLMVDAAGYGQFPRSIHFFGKDVFESDPIRNTIFSIHFYEHAGGSTDDIKINIDKVIEQELAVVIGEFGHQHHEGDVDEDYILEYTEKTKVGWIAWSWKGNSGGVDYLDLSNDWTGTDLTKWGERIVNGPNGLRETSEMASIFK